MKNGQFLVKGVNLGLSNLNKDRVNLATSSKTVRILLGGANAYSRSKSFLF